MPQQNFDQRRAAQDAIAFGGKPQRLMRASHWAAYEKGTLLGFFTLHLVSGLVVHGCTLHRKDADNEWIGLPGRPQLENGQIKRDAEGKILYAPVVEIVGEVARERFKREALTAVHRLLGDVAR